MTFSPLGLGDRRPIHNTFFTDSGNFSLSGLDASDLAMHFLNSSNSALTVGTGTWSNLSQDEDGVWSADYTPSAQDVEIARTSQMYPVVMVSGAPVPFDPQTLEIDNLP